MNSLVLAYHCVILNMFYEVIIIPLNFQPETGTVYRVEAI
jgi:hypothetical protein